MRAKKTNKTKQLIVGVLSIFAILFLVSFISAATDYCLKKVYNGQSVPAYPGFTSKSEHLDCKNGLCTVYGFSRPTGSLAVCLDPDGYYYSNFNKCEEYCEGNGGPVDPGPLTLTANFPFPDNGMFTKTNFFMDIYTNKIAHIDLIDNVAETQKILCPNCMVYQRSQTFKQGFNDITIRAVKGTEILEQRIRFFIDNKKPRISKTLPQSRKYANGEFSVFYDEANLKKVELYYGLVESPVIKQATGCENGVRKNCTTVVDLSAFDGQEISYWFSITDIADNNVVSRSYIVKVDKTSPVITSFDYSIDRTYVSFLINVTELNFDRVIYYDNDEPRAKTLCTSLRYGSCARKTGFREGHHIVKIDVKDKAGNIVSRTIEFDIA